MAAAAEVWVVDMMTIQLHENDLLVQAVEVEDMVEEVSIYICCPSITKSIDDISSVFEESLVHDVG